MANIFWYNLLALIGIVVTAFTLYKKEIQQKSQLFLFFSYYLYALHG